MPLRRTAMNRIDKLKALSDTLEGNGAILRQMHQERRKKQMPFLEVHGVVNIQQCPTALLDIQVMPTESILDGPKTDVLSLKDCLQRFEQTGWKKPYYNYSAVGAIEAGETQYDDVVLTAIKLRRETELYATLSGQTVKELRQYFRQCSASVNQSFILLSFDSKPL